MRPSINDIKTEVEAYFGFKPNEFCVKSKKRKMVVPRQIAMYLAKQYTHSSLSEIGYALGRKDHATVLHAAKTVTNLMETEKDFRYKVQAIQSIINAKWTNLHSDEDMSNKSRGELINLAMLYSIQNIKLKKQLYRMKKYCINLKRRNNVRT